LDGTRTLDEVRQAFERRFRPRRISLEEVERFARQLVAEGLAPSGGPQAGSGLLERRRQRRREERWARLTNLLALQVPLWDPDRLLGRLLPYLRWLFTPPSVACGAGTVLAALLLV